MSASSFRVGKQIGHDLVAKADMKHLNGRGAWDTNDLGDFVAGMIEACLDEYSRLYPERIQKHEIRIEHG